MISNDSIIISTLADSIPKVYHYSPQTEESKEILVTELLGDDLNTIYGKLGPFSTATVMKIGLQMVKILFNFVQLSFKQLFFNKSIILVGYFRKYSQKGNRSL